MSIITFYSKKHLLDSIHKKNITMKYMLTVFLILFFSNHFFSQVKFEDEIIVGYDANQTEINQVKFYLSSSIKDTLSIIDVNSKQLIYNDVVLEDVVVNCSDTKEVVVNYHGNEKLVSLISQYVYIGTVLNKTLVISVTNEKKENDY